MDFGSILELDLILGKQNTVDLESMERVVLLLTLLAAPCLSRVPRYHPVHKAPRELLHRISVSPHAVANPHHPLHLQPAANGVSADHLHASWSTSPRATPLDFGGDPSGFRDSTTALQKCIAVCLNQSRMSPNGNFPGDNQGQKCGYWASWENGPCKL